MHTVVAAGTVYYTFSFLWAIVFALLCGWIAVRKGRSALLWGILGFFFSIITLIVVLVLRPRR